MSSGVESNDEASSEGWADSLLPIHSSRVSRTRKGAQQATVTSLPNAFARLPWTIVQGSPCNSLVIVQQPTAEFYKDQGGKGSHLTVTVRLTTEEMAKRWAAPAAGQAHELGGTVPLPEPNITIPLEATLLYESGKRVDDTQILKIMQKKPPSLELRYDINDSWCYEGEIHFRLEKVSLRNDGQRFKLQINTAIDSTWVAETHQKVNSHGLSDNPDHPHLLTNWLESVHGCSTVPINVLSKRKNPGATSETSTKRTARSGASKRSRVETSTYSAVSPDLSQITLQLEQMNATMNRLMEMVTHNSERLTSIEAVVNQIPNPTILRQPENASMPSLGRFASMDFLLNEKDKEDLGNGLPLPLVTRAPSWDEIKPPQAESTPPSLPQWPEMASRSTPPPAEPGRNPSTSLQAPMIPV